LREFLKYNNVKKYFTLLFLIAIVIESFGQIGGLSGSKIASFSATNVPHKKIEFEPSFFYVHSEKYWDSDRNLVPQYPNSDSVVNESGVNLRFSYGVAKNFELGITVPINLRNSYFGAKYQFYQNDNLHLAALGGFAVPMGNGVMSKHLHSGDNTVQAGLGMALSYYKGENFSFDVNAEYNRFLKKTIDGKLNNYLFTADFGYYLFDHTFQVIGAASYDYSKMNDGIHDALIIYPGFTLETGKTFIIVASIPISVYGHNVGKGLGFNFALTLLFN